MYAVAGVRAFRVGNIGPALIDIERSMNEEGYRGMDLHAPEGADEGDWVYCSPMSWHPSSKKVMWPETLRGKGDMRIRIAHLLDYAGGPAVPAKQTPEEIPCAEKDLAKLFSADGSNAAEHSGVVDGCIEGKIAGKQAGYIEFRQRTTGALFALSGQVEETYVNFSDDGKTFYNGYEKSGYSVSEGSVYEADLTMSGADPGEMKLRAAFSKIGAAELPRLLFDQAADGKPKSCGYAAYRGVTLRIEDMIE